MADSVNPLLVLGLLAAPFRSSRTGAPRFWLRSAVGVGVAVLIAEAGKRYEIWPGHPTFPSGHETFALAASTLLLCRDVRWLAIVLPLVLILAWALVAAHYHAPVDVAGALLVGPPAALLVHWLTAAWAGNRQKT